TYARNQRKVPSITGHVVPEPVRTRAQYEKTILEPMYHDIAPHDPLGLLHAEWLNSRGAIARFDRNAIEIRLIDTQEQPGADLAIAALVVGVIERLYRGRTTTLAAADAIETDVLAGILRGCVERGEDAMIYDEAYLRVLGVDGPKTAGEIWRTLAEPLATSLAPHRAALDVVLNDGTLATRLLRAIGDRIDASTLAATYRRLCDCLAEG